MKTPPLYSRMASIACGFLIASFPMVSDAAIVNWTASDNATVSSGTAATDNGARIGGTFHEVTLGIGDSIRFAGSFTFAGNNPNSSEGFRLGLYDNHGNTALSDPSAGTSFNGYTINAVTTGSAGEGGNIFRKTGNGWYGNTVTGIHGTRLIENLKSGNPAIPLATNAVMAAGTYDFSLILTRMGEAALRIDVLIVDKAAPSRYRFAHTHTDTAAAGFDFNQTALFLSMNSSQGARRVDFADLAVVFKPSAESLVSWTAYQNATVTPEIKPSITATDNGARIGGTFDAVTLGIGDSIRAAGSFAFAGLNPSNPEGFRFGLYDNNGDSSLAAPNEGNTFRGYSFQAVTTGGKDGFFFRKSFNGWYGNTSYSGRILRDGLKSGDPSSPSVTNATMAASTYDFRFTLTRMAENTVHLDVEIVNKADPSRYHFAHAYTDTAAVNFRFNQIAFLLSMNSSQGARPITFTNLALVPGTATKDPYGICAHISRSDSTSRNTQLDLIRNVGIAWARTDFEWKHIERSQGQWDFSSVGATVADAALKQVKILPILDYDVPWASPAWKNLNAWGEYVRNLVSRYGNTLRHWEVYNEPNLDAFWRGPVSGEEYAQLLQRTWEEIKRMDPSLTALYGGVNGVPLAYVEDTLKAGAGRHFDVMNVHPYNKQGSPELLIGQIDGLRKLMDKYEVGNKPIWFTEVGWTTAKWDLDTKAFPAALGRLGLDASQISVAVVRDPLGFGEWGAPHLMMPADLGFPSETPILLDGIPSLDVARHPVLIPTFDEAFPAAYLPALRDYVKRGGTLLLPNGIPLYYEILPDGRRVSVGDRHMADFHMGWDAWWTNGAVPRDEEWHRQGPGFTNDFDILMHHTVGRSLNGRNLRAGDTLIPVIESGSGSGFRGTILGIYKLDSDLRGNIVVNLHRKASVSPQVQAEFLPRTYLISLAKNVERIFWYNLRTTERNPYELEDFFGIVQQDYSHKPAYAAYGTLTRLCPNGSTSVVLEEKDRIYTANWVRPDGAKVWAIWTPDIGGYAARLKMEGNLMEACNHLGAPLSVSNGTRAISPSILYLVGPSAVKASRTRTVASYGADFRTGSPLPGWSYLWNASGPAGDPTSFRPLVWAPTVGSYTVNGQSTPDNTAPLAPWLSLAKTGGHPGRGTAQATGTDRFAIAAYTVKERGHYAVANGSVRIPGAGSNGGQVTIDVQASQGIGFTRKFEAVIPRGSATTFSANVGELQPGDTLFVGIGPNMDDRSDSFTHDFDIVFNENGEALTQPASNSTAPATAALVATAGNGSVTLNWSAVSGATKHIVKVSTQAGGPYVILASVNAPALTYTDGNLVGGMTYYYVVSTEKSSGQSVDSPEASATP